VLDQTELFQVAQEALENALEAMLQSIRLKLSDPGLHWQKKKVLSSALKALGRVDYLCQKSVRAHGQ